MLKQQPQQHFHLPMYAIAYSSLVFLFGKKKYVTLLEKNNYSAASFSDFSVVSFMVVCWFSECVIAVCNLFLETAERSLYLVLSLCVCIRERERPEQRPTHLYRNSRLAHCLITVCGKQKLRLGEGFALTRRKSNDSESPN